MLLSSTRDTLDIVKCRTMRKLLLRLASLSGGTVKVEIVTNAPGQRVSPIEIGLTPVISVFNQVSVLKAAIEKNKHEG